MFPQYGICNVYFGSENIKLPDVLDTCKACLPRCVRNESQWIICVLLTVSPHKR
jgi:hypothetical protein